MKITTLEKEKKKLGHLRTRPCWRICKPSNIEVPIKSTVKPRYSAPAFNIIPPVEHTNFSLKKCFYSYLYVGNREYVSLEHNFSQSLKIRYGGV